MFTAEDAEKTMAKLSKAMRVGLGIIALIVLGSLALTLKSRFDWKRYMADHHCRPAGTLIATAGRRCIAVMG